LALEENRVPILDQDHSLSTKGGVRKAQSDIASASRFVLKVGEISLGVTARRGMRVALQPDLLPFASDSRSCDIELESCWAECLQIPSAPPVFTSGGLWNAYEEDGGTAFYFRAQFLGEAPYKKAWFDRTFATGRVWLSKRCFQENVPVYPLEYPLDELLMIHRLATGLGAEIHACGVIADGLGRLFVGHSGAGKSTSSRLWMKRSGTKVLSDDRIILRQDHNEFRMYGTPWHGDAGIAAQASHRLDRIFLLEQAPKNEVLALEPSRAAAELLARTFVPHYSASGLASTLLFLEKLVKTIPVAIFRFTPEPGAVEEILRAA
jgi:hypothetical protein